MMNSEIVSTIAAFAGIAALVGSLLALFVGLKVKSELAQFRVEFMNELDNRFERSATACAAQTSHDKDEATYRSTTGERLKSVEVEVYRDREKLDEIIAVIRLKPDSLIDRKRK